MKKSLYSFILFFIFLIGRAQDPGNINIGVWGGALLRADGALNVGGVEAFCTKVLCGDEEYVLIRLVNNNSYQVQVEWVDGFYVSNNWIYSEGNVSKKINLPASSVTEGSCNSEPKLKVRIADFINNNTQSKYYSVTGLKVQ